MMPSISDRFYCRLPGGSAFMTLIGLEEESLKFMIVRTDGIRRTYNMTKQEWEEFREKYIVVSLGDNNESHHDSSSGVR